MKARRASALGIDAQLLLARSRLRRVAPRAVPRLLEDGAVLVDIRPLQQRALEGEVPGAVVVERNVLEWRFDPRSDASLPVASYDLQVLVLCQEGYTSSLAAVALQDLGIWRATDVVGGFAAWRDSGMPWARTVSPTVDQSLRWRPEVQTPHASA